MLDPISQLGHLWACVVSPFGPRWQRERVASQIRSAGAASTLRGRLNPGEPEEYPGGAAAGIAASLMLRVPLGPETTIPAL